MTHTARVQHPHLVVHLTGRLPTAELTPFHALCRLNGSSPPSPVTEYPPSDVTLRCSPEVVQVAFGISGTEH